MAEPIEIEEATRQQRTVIEGVKRQIDEGFAALRTAVDATQQAGVDERTLREHTHAEQGAAMREQLRLEREQHDATREALKATRTEVDRLTAEGVGLREDLEEAGRLLTQAREELAKASE